ncbi:MAG: SDR family NAD(P)-dependent oxidoreductase, partial [Syntrophales bacterium]|nr:SDR family NAD(P)-dependent oxidoreductase [Syntrophales bacterium]
MKPAEAIAIVTGGASGLGEACVKDIVAAGGRVCIFDLQVERAEQLVSSLGDRVVFAAVDVTNEESVQAGVEKTLAAFGGLNVVINCAGVGDPGKVLSKKGPLPLAHFQRVVQINLVGTFNVLRMAMPIMV